MKIRVPKTISVIEYEEKEVSTGEGIFFLIKSSLKEKGILLKDFEKKVGFSNGYFSRIVKTDNFQSLNAGICARVFLETDVDIVKILANEKYSKEVANGRQ